MKSIKTCYAELLSLTQLFLLREHQLNEVKTVDPQTLAFFQNKNRFSSPSIHPLQQASTKPALPSQPRQMPTRPSAASPDPRPIETRIEPVAATKSEPMAPQPALPAPQQHSPIPQPLIIQDKQTKTNRDSKGMALEPLTTPTAADQREFWKLFPTLFPEVSLFETIPNDTLAQKLKNAWLDDQIIPPVVILSFYDEEKQLAFLKNLARAISLRLAPTRVLSASKLEKEKGWETLLKSPALRLVIASDYGLYLQPSLMPFYREIPQQGKHFLNQIPLLLLSDLAFYLKDPHLKSLLWRAICNEFAASQHHFSTR